MALEALLGDLTPARFVADFFGRLPYAGRGTARVYSALGQWSTIETILAQGGADLMVVRQNERYAGPPPKTLDDARELFAAGHTLLVRHAERHHPGIAELAASFAADLAAPVNVHLYATPGGQRGFGWHYDAEEVFILQTTGRKEYSLRKNTVNPWPLEETLPENMHYDGEITPLVKCELAADDWLYIPSGYWHYGAARDDALSLAVGLMPRTGLELIDRIRGRALASLLWRQRLPTTGAASPLSAEELRARYREIAAELGDDLKRLLADDTLLDELLGLGADPRPLAGG